jgi:hypothetical protein
MWRLRPAEQKDGSPGSKWETASFVLTPEARSQLLEAIESNQLMTLHRFYEHTGTMDGILESVSIQRGERKKVVTCRNHFPDSFVRFGKQLRAILSYQHGSKWREAPYEPR